MATKAESAVSSLDRDLVELINSLKTFGFLFAVTMLQWYVYINPPLNGWSSAVAGIYMQMGTTFLVIVVLVTSKTKIRVQSFTTIGVLTNALAGFSMAWAFVLVFYGQLLGVSFGTTATTDVVGVLLTQVLFVAVTEEMIFRWLVPAYLSSIFTKRYHWLALLLPQITFASFHASVYQGDWSALFTAFIFGCVMMTAFEFKPPFGPKNERKKLGLGFTIGCHAAYNLVLLGVLAPHGIRLLIGG